MTQTYEELLPLLPKALQNRTKSSGQPAFLSGIVTPVGDRREREAILASDRPAVRPCVAASGGERPVRRRLPGR
ncbi:hypothetical protein [Deinococcus aerolatus]|nr:hypothetical protein [Deinococcus aerolatus]